MPEIPNLDAMSVEDLWAFWSKHQRGRAYLALFPEGGKGTRKATGLLAAYACNKAVAMKCRLDGAIDRALVYEKICEDIYDRLGKEAQW